MKKRKNEGFLSVFFSSGLLLILILICLIFLNQKYFQFKRIDLEGQKTIREEEIWSELLAYKGENIFLLNVKDLEKDLKRDERIASVKVYKVFPDCLRIEIKEHKILGYLNGDRAYPVDEGGRVHDGKNFRGLEGSSAEIKSDKENIKLKERITDDPYRLKFLSSIGESQLLKKMSKIDLSLEEKATIIYNNISVSFSSLDDISYKISLLETVISDLEKRGVEAGKLEINSSNNPVIVTDTSL